MSAIAARLPELLASVHACLPGKDPYQPDPSDHAGLMGELKHAFESLRSEYDAEQGPLATWKAPWTDDIWGRLDLRIEEIDEEGEDWREFFDSAFGRAGRAYRRACGWDFSPGEAGVWVVAYAPASWVGGDDNEGYCSGNLVSFAILHDRDSDGEVESLAHVWTARAFRRRGAARRVVALAREQYPLREIEGPATDDGAAFLRAALPDLVEVAS